LLRREYNGTVLFFCIEVKNSQIVIGAIWLLVLTGLIITPAYAARIIEVTKEVDTRKELLATVLTDLRNYKEIFPTLVKDVIIDPKTNQAKFIIIVQGMHEAEVKSTIQPDGSFVVDILSGDLKDSKIIITLQKRNGFDGTPNGATTIKATLILQTSWLISMALSFVSDSDIQTTVGDGLYEVAQYAESEFSQNKVVKVDHAEKIESPVLEAAQRLDFEKEKSIITLNTTLKSNQETHRSASENAVFNKPELFFASDYIDDVFTFFKQFIFW
jgi:hypothetical protein